MIPYQDLFAELDSMGSSTLSSSNVSQPANSDATDVVADFFIKHAPQILQEFRDKPGNRFVLRDVDGIAESAAKKVLLYADSSLLLSSIPVVRNVSYSLADHGDNQWTDAEVAPLGPTFINDLLSIRSALISGSCALLPVSVIQRVDDSPDYACACHGTLPVEKRHDSVNFDAADAMIDANQRRIPSLDCSPRRVLEVLASDRAINAQLQEDEEACGGAVRFFLPRIRGLTLEQLIDLREEERNSFTRFQHALMKFFEMGTDQTPESAMLKMFEEVNYQIAVLNDRFREISRRRRWEFIAQALTTFGLLSLYTMPAELAKVISGVLGVASLSKVTSYIASEEWSSKKLASSDFFYAWKASRLKSIEGN